MFNIIVGIIGALMHPIVTVQAWWDTLAEHDKEAPPAVTDPDIIRGIERATGEKFDPGSGKWAIQPSDE